MGTVGKGKLEGRITSSGSMTGKIAIGKVEYPYYKGSCDVMPTNEEQVLKTANKIMSEDVYIRAIPETYGRITYNQDKTIMIT